MCPLIRDVSLIVPVDRRRLSQNAAWLNMIWTLNMIWYHEHWADKRRYFSIFKIFISKSKQLLPADWLHQLIGFTKEKSHFAKFDIAEFNPLISEDLLDGCISFGKSITATSDSVINIVNNSISLFLIKYPHGYRKKKLLNYTWRWCLMMKLKIVSLLGFTSWID